MARDRKREKELNEPQEVAEVEIDETPDSNEGLPSERQSGGENTSGTSSSSGGTNSGVTEGTTSDAKGGTSGPTPPPDPQQVLQQSWGANMDQQTARQFSGLSLVRQARASQLQREYNSLAQAYGANDPGVQAVRASLTYQQTLGSRLGLASTTSGTTAPKTPVNGWAVYGRVRNADLTPAPQLTVFLADDSRAWLKQFAYAFTDQTGYFTLTYDPSATAAGSRKTRQSQAAASETLSAYLEVSNETCKLMYIDATAMSLKPGASVYRDIVLDANVPLGSPPCQQGAAPTTPPATKKR
jgi:hypothetical protein